jgi:methionyl-tRNA synthetase
MPKTYSLTTTLPYVNADPHIGFALEIVQTDALARLHRLRGEEVVFNTGTDEHGIKIFRKAQELGLDPQKYCDEYAAKFHGLRDALNLTYTNFIRTTDTHHKSSAQSFWFRCKANGDIYKKQYSVKYCVGCELEKTDSELVDERCPLHPKLDIEHIEEENYFFAFSKYQKPLLDFYASHPDFVIPEGRYNEIKSFVEGGLQDFSISRLTEKMPWGVPVPDDADHVMYVWFDALVNYISTLGWPENDVAFAATWPSVQVAGKDNLRQQSAMWQAMLLSAQLPPSQQIFIHGFISVAGQKMSKSLGNVVNPYDLVAKYGTDAVRHYLLGGLPSYNDGDYTTELFENWYSTQLANGIGNLTARVFTMIEKYCDSMIQNPADEQDFTDFWKNYNNAFDTFRFDEVLRIVNGLVTQCDEAIEQAKPWSMWKEGKEQETREMLYTLAENLRVIAKALLPITPTTAGKILSGLGEESNQPIKIIKPEILFPRLQKPKTK